ncbi:hypothetical protein GCM10009827_092040 [Dactylosporangium maewongense]|uniref:Integral membrane protein n=1 Tax=Dactylosporangium maewongense TaxID=634393 RepID=A0ABN2CFB6_9ACTN
MNQAVVRRVTGLCGILTAIALIVEVPLYFIYDGPPPDWNVLTRILIGILAFVAFTGLVTGLRELVRRAAPDHEWAASLVSAAGLMYITVTLVSMGLEAGAVIAADTAIDPTIDVSGTYILYGTIGRTTLALFLAALGSLVLRTGILPRWTGVTAVTLAVVSAAFIPSIYFGNDPANFYAANGWGSTATVGALLSYWLLAFGISVTRSARR